MTETYSSDRLAREGVELDDKNASSDQALADLIETLVSRVLEAELRGVEGKTRGDNGTRLDLDGLSRGDSASVDRGEGNGGERGGEELGLHFCGWRVAFSTREVDALRGGWRCDRDQGPGGEAAAASAVEDRMGLCGSG